MPRKWSTPRSSSTRCATATGASWCPGAGSGLGGRAPRLEAGWIPEALRFVARGDAPFELVFGSATATAAETSLEMLDPAAGARPQAVQPQSTQAGPMVEAGGAARLLPPPPPLPWKQWMLWAVLVAGVLGLAVLAWRLTREIGSGG